MLSKHLVAYGDMTVIARVQETGAMKLRSMSLVPGWYITDCSSGLSQAYAALSLQQPVMLLIRLSNKFASLERVCVSHYMVIAMGLPVIAECAELTQKQACSVEIQKTQGCHKVEHLRDKNGWKRKIPLSQCWHADSWRHQRVQS